MILEIFQGFLLSDIIAALAIICVYIASPLFSKIFRDTWRYNAWIFLILFLLCPIGIILNYFNKIRFNNISPTENNIFLISMIENQDITVKSYDSIQSGIRLPYETISFVWMICAVIFLLYYIIQYICLRTQINKHNKVIITEDGKPLVIKIRKRKNIDVFYNPTITSPMIIGLFKPIIILTDKTYTSQERDIIIEHESMHYLRKDLWIKFLCIIVLSLHWYNPFVYFMVNSVGKDMEICCDTSLINNKGSEFKSIYADVLMKQVISSNKKMQKTFACMGGKTSEMKKRFKNIFSEKKRKGRMAFILVGVLILSMCGFAFHQRRIWK